ncbi:hypothetical protein F5984_13150 [Rudanella paleaurantiibacter]|uniref:DUF4468 domain-containing protein n=1 Tax=Rudanella paleaurantiibacter TaxID=2614655 RepID=A0A7J5TYD7_9BACT|nr:hypothetical protein [Rudanella paleaurantiibacter]KAB7730124.1 hypothetical protein F5984_13150 [Rudanella paleaurantiibacter]
MKPLLTLMLMLLIGLSKAYSQAVIDPYTLDYSNPNCSLTPEQQVAVYNDGRNRGVGLRNYLRGQYAHLAETTYGYQWGPVYTQETVLVSKGMVYQSSGYLDSGYYYYELIVPQTMYHFDYKFSGTGIISTNENILTSFILSDPAVQNNIQNIIDGNFPPYNIQCPAYKAALLDGFAAGITGLTVSP